MAINNPDWVVEYPTILNSGTTSGVTVSTTSFVYGTGVIDPNSIMTYLNGVEYAFAYTDSSSNIVFHTGGVTPSGSTTTLYFDATHANFSGGLGIETTDYVILKYMVVT